MDVCTSYYHHMQLFKPIYSMDPSETSFERFTEIFLKGQVSYGNYWAHLKVAE